MKRPSPSGREITFNHDELFFSRTDSRGVILYGNDVFVRISGYTREALLGKPHSIIRHPDMPRAVFKLLWSTIETGEPIAAYVKNLSAEGHAYWVLAVVFPVGDEYLSIRLKPSTPFLGVVKGVYEKMLAEEAVSGMEGSTALLGKILKEAGFSDYPRFMTAILTSELEARDIALADLKHAIRATDEGSTGDLEGSGDSEALASNTLEAIRDVSRDGLRRFKELSGKMAEFEKASKAFQDKTTWLLASFKRIQVVSLNVTVFARQLGESAVALGVISKEFHRLAMDVERSTEELAGIVNSIIQSMQRSSLDIASLKLQMDMVAFFVQESLAKAVRGTETIFEAFKPLEDNAKVFSLVGQGSADSAANKFESLKKDLNRFADANEGIDRVVRSLEIITQMAALESARIPSHQQAFASYLQQMEQFNTGLKTTTAEIKAFTRILLEIQNFVQDRLPDVTGSMGRILELAFSMRASAPDEGLAAPVASVTTPQSEEPPQSEEFPLPDASQF